jgi:hypothetical protein
MEATKRNFWLAVCFAAAVFASAFLLFQIQPLVGKQILPRFGGSPAVWTTCLLFFQTVLFAGYLYAHLSDAWLSARGQALLHVAVLAIAVLMPFALSSDRRAGDPSSDPVWQILWRLSAGIGLPYFALAATGPLLQAWFARTFPGRVPYRLYALSNFGSLLALVSYPFVVEHRFSLPQQARLWSWGYLGFAVLCSAIAVRIFLDNPPIQADLDVRISERRPTWLQYLCWLAFPAAASIALMATTNQICADVAAVPFLWVAPLALYLVTFIIAFDHPRWYHRTITAVLTLVAIYGAALVHREGVGSIKLYDFGMTGRCIELFADAVGPVLNAGAEASESPAGPRVYVGFMSFLVLNLAAMFGICMLCHGELVRQRPAPRYLTSFYVMIAAGGALGGAAVTLIAPRVFNTFFEWKLCMFIGTIGVLTLILHALVNRALAEEESSARKNSALIARLVLVVLLLPASFVLLDIAEYLHSPKRGVRFQHRNFFGTFTVRERNPDDPRMNNFVLLHGMTVHGAQFTAPERRGMPVTYYGTPSGIGRTMNYYRSNPPQGPLSIGSIGLGTGTLAAFAGEGDSISFYEIDPDMIDLASSGEWFTYVRDCQARGAECQMKLGDARITLENEKGAERRSRYHVLAVDAFSGDAVPMHLLTTDAFLLYLERITTAALDGEDGALAVNVSNRYLDLERVVYAAAEQLGIKAVLIESAGESQRSINSADWMILSHNEALMRTLAPFGTAENTSKPPVLWTDTRNSLFEVLK